ncbi:unnamed protein product [Moneuplotes crassus]|uniref:Secreted protein n=1 Tax=Euplotes crassus TaxID=5936 RepID=A0AAD2D0B6_EUPCR|nr:unnamed protein product [Moneuplotes crassus]
MKSIIVDLVCLILISFCHAKFSMFDLGRTSKDVEKYTKVARSGLQSFMTEFYSPQNHTLDDVCLGEEFKGWMVKFVDNFKRYNDMTDFAISQIECLLVSIRLTVDFCQAFGFVSDAGRECRSNNCGV